MTADRHHRRKTRRISRILESEKGRKLAIASAVGVAGVGAFGASVDTPTPTEQPTFDDPVKEAVAKTMVQRLAGQGWDLPNVDHQRVDFWVDRFQNNPEMREKFEGFLTRAGQYVPMLSIKLAERDMPNDLIFLAMIESGFDPTAYSQAHASGIWQFISETGRRYGLRVNHAVDERNHPEKATEAALDYLTELHDRFDSWYLAAAAYNTGENRVGRIMREEFGTEKASSEQDYYKIWDRLPKETRDYVPLMIAAARIAKDPGTYGFDHIVPMAPEHVEEIEAAPGTLLASIADAAGVDAETIVALNPHITGARTPSDGTYPVRVPGGTTDQIASAMSTRAAQ